MPVICDYLARVGQSCDGVKLQTGVHVHPSSCSFLVGCSWSVAICQDINLHEGLDLHTLVICACTCYVDNIGMISLRRNSRKGCFTTLCTISCRVGFSYMKPQTRLKSAELLGVRLGPRAGQSQITHKRYHHKLKSGELELFRRGRCSGRWKWFWGT